MLSRIRFLVVMAVLGLTVRAQYSSPDGAFTVPVPNDPLEVVTGPIRVADTPQSRQGALELLDRARENYAIRKSTDGYQLKASFTVNSGGATLYDGNWQMEETFVPQVGLRWNAQASAGYRTTGVSVKGQSDAEGSTDNIPLRLHEARAALLGPIATRQYAERSSIRTSAATFHGLSLTCVLLSATGGSPAPAPGRLWEESEECIDPQTGLLKIHSLAPGWYEMFDYTDGPVLGDHKFPRKVTETEGGKTVMVLRVDSLTEPESADPRLFAPTEAMAASSPGIVLGEARKISFVADRGSSNGTAWDAVCILGVIAPSGKLMEAHSLQPGDPHSGAAVGLANRMKFSPTSAPGERPVQRFVFVTEKFAAQAGGQP